MSLVIGFALIGACWFIGMYRREITDRAIDAYEAITLGLPEVIHRHEHMRAMDRLGTKSLAVSRPVMETAGPASVSGGVMHDHLRSSPSASER